MIEVTDLSPRHFGRLASRAREIDRIECAGGVKKALRYGHRYSVLAKTALADGEPVAAFGVVPVSLATGDAIVWAVATDEALKYPRDWLTIGRLWSAQVRAVFPRARNRVHRDNLAAIRWLTRIGFAVEPRSDSLFRDFAYV